MRQTTMIILLAASLLAGSGLATGCQGQATPQGGSDSGEREAAVRVVSASGTVVPLRWAVLSFPLGGRVQEVAVPAGAEVRKGDPLVRLEADDLGQAVAQAQAGLDTARAALAQVKAGPRPQQMAVSRQEVSAAEAALEQAQAALEGAEARQAGAEAAAKAAQASLSAAQANVAAAQAELALLKAGASPEQRTIAQLQVDQARNSLWGAQAQRDSVGGAEKRGEMRQSDLDGAEAAVGNAHVALQIAETAYEEMQAGPRAEEVASAQAGVQAAQSAVSGAQAQVESAQAQSAGAKAEAALAEAQVAAAEARAAQAGAQLELLEAGPRAEDVGVAEAQVAQAEAALKAARTALARTEMTAPFDGTVARLDARPGETLLPGQAVLRFGDLTALQVETTDLDEVDAPRVKVGQVVDVTFDALPDRQWSGKVEAIEAIATPGQGGTTYKVTVSLEGPAEDLRWGMTAFVDIVVSD